MIIWQDAVLTSGNLILTAALVPSVLSQHKPAVTTSLLSGVVLLAFGLTYLSLHLWFAAAGVSLNAVLWVILVLQRHKAKAS